MGVGQDLQRCVWFQMKFVGLSETRRGLLDMEFVHLYKPELKLWRGSDPHLAGFGSKSVVGRVWICLLAMSLTMQTGQQSGSSLALKNREG